MLFELAEALEFLRRNGSGELRPVGPPRDLAKYILAMPDIPFPRLRRVAHAPVFGPSGQLLLQNGYDPASELYVDLAPDLEDIGVPRAPKVGVIRSYRNLILNHLLGDFPFISPAEVAHAFGALLLFFVRPMITGPTPIHVIEKPTPGTGATLLAQALGDVVSGQFILVDECRSDDEWSRRLLAVLRTGPTAIVIDNVTRPLNSGALAAAVTGGRFTGRIVGTSDTEVATVDCLWFITANNPKFSFEGLRRSIRIRLDAGLEHPEQGRRFRYPNLRRWIQENRLILVQGCLTLVQAWVAAGRPRGEQILGGFEEWSEVIGGILDVADVPGFLANSDDHRASADGEAPFRTFVCRWHQKHGSGGVTTKQVFDLAEDLDLDLGHGSDQSRRIKLGKLLERHQGRTFGELRLVRAEGSTGGSARWKVDKVTSLNQVCHDSTDGQ